MGLTAEAGLLGAAVLFLLNVLFIPASAMVAMSIILVVCSSTYLEGTASTGLSEIVRFASVLVLAGVIWNPAVQVPSGELRQVPNCIQFVRALTATIVAYLAFSTVGHGMYWEFLLYIAGAVLAVIYGSIFVRWIPGAQIRNGVFVALLLVMSGSVAFGLLRPSDGLLGDRLRGLTVNPNLLGFYTVLTFALILSYQRFNSWLFAAGAVTGVALVWSGSRAALVATVLLVTANLALRRGPLRPLWLLLGMSSLVLVLAHPGWVTESDLTILRSNNSRTDSYEYTMAVLKGTEWRGIGLDAEVVQVASTPLRALTHAGLVGGIVILAMYAVIIYCSAKVGRRTLLFAGAMVVHSFFEGWLLTPVGPMTMCFLATWCALAKCESAASAPAAHGWSSWLRRRAVGSAGSGLVLAQHPTSNSP